MITTALTTTYYDCDCYHFDYDCERIDMDTIKCYAAMSACV